MSKNFPRLEIPLNDLLNIFQLHNPLVFNQAENDDDVRELYNDIMQVTDFFESPTLEILENPSPISFSVSSRKSDKGGAIRVNRIEVCGQDAEVEDWLFITIAENVDLGVQEAPDDRFALRPFFLLSGKIEQGQIFVPHHCGGVRIEDDGDIAMTFPNTPEDFYALVLYADSAFRAIMTDVDMDAGIFAFYLDPSQVKIARDEYNDIKDRTPTDLARYVAKCADINQPKPVSAFPMMATPPMLQ